MDKIWARKHHRGEAGVSGPIVLDSESGGAKGHYPNYRTRFARRGSARSEYFSNYFLTSVSPSTISGKQTLNEPAATSRSSGLRSWRDNPSSTRP
jgi:hypothetical protein